MLAAALPVVLFHNVVSDIASEFRVDARYLIAEWSPWLLLACGLLFLAPVAWSAGRDSESRWYPRSRNAYAGWGITPLPARPRARRPGRFDRRAVAVSRPAGPGPAEPR